MSSLEEEFEYHAHIVSWGRMFDPFSLPFDFGSMSQEKENSGIQISDLSSIASVSKEAREFLGSIFGPLLGPVTTEIGELLADKIRQIRAENWIKVIEKSSKKAKQQGLEIKPANLKILTPIINYSSAETDEEMQERWANLLLSEVTEGKVHPSIPEILNAIDSVEAKLLDLMFKSKREHKKGVNWQENIEFKDVTLTGFSCTQLREKIEFTESSLDNLLRLQICRASEHHYASHAEIHTIAKEIQNLHGLSSYSRAPEYFYDDIQKILRALGTSIYRPYGEWRI